MRGKPRDVERNETLDRAMEYVGVVGIELVDMLVSVNTKVEALVPHVPTQHIFSRDGLQNFIYNHQDCLECLEEQLGNLITMMENVMGWLSVAKKSYCYDLRRVEWLNGVRATLALSSNNVT